MATLNDWYAQNDARIQGIAKANKVDLGVAKDMLVSNIKGTTNYAGGGVANMGDLNKGYTQALAYDTQNKTSQSPVNTYYDSYLAQQQKALQQAQAAAEKAAKERTQAAIDTNNAYIPQVNQQTDKQLNEAYISYMKGKKAAPEQLSAMGYTGGATESSLLGMDTNYQGIRGDVESARTQSLDQIQQNANQIQSTGNADLSDLAAQYYNQYIAASQQAMEASRAQENIDASYAANTTSDMLSKAQLAAQYGDYSLLKQLGINPATTSTAPTYSTSSTSSSSGSSSNAKSTTPTGVSYTNADVDKLSAANQRHAGTLIQQFKSGLVTDEDFIRQMNSLGINTYYTY